MAEPVTYTFKNGVQAILHSVSPFTIQAIEGSIKRPEPPTQEVDHADGTKHLEPNPMHPAHLAALTERRNAVLQKQQDVMLTLGVSVDVDAEAVAGFRAVMSEFQVPLDKSDKLVFLKHICMASTDEIRAVVGQITRLSMPGEEAVQQAADSFKSEPVG